MALISNLRAMCGGMGRRNHRKGRAGIEPEKTALRLTLEAQGIGKVRVACHAFGAAMRLPISWAEANISRRRRVAEPTPGRAPLNDPPTNSALPRHS